MALRWVGLDKAVFSSDELPPGVTDKERFRVWHDLFHQHVGHADFVAPEGPFEAHMAFPQRKNLGFARTTPTVAGPENGGPPPAADDQGPTGPLSKARAGLGPRLHRRPPGQKMP